MLGTTQKKEGRPRGAASLADQAYYMIRERILRGHLPLAPCFPGASLPPSSG